jgi:hypothetical protein
VKKISSKVLLMTLVFLLSFGSTVFGSGAEKAGNRNSTENGNNLEQIKQQILNKDQLIKINLSKPDETYPKELNVQLYSYLEDKMVYTDTIKNFKGKLNVKYEIPSSLIDEYKDNVLPVHYSLILSSNEEDGYFHKVWDFEKHYVLKPNDIPDTDLYKLAQISPLNEINLQMIRLGDQESNHNHSNDMSTMDTPCGDGIISKTYYDNKWTKIGEVHAVEGVTSFLEFQQGATSSVEIGLNYSDGTFSASGSKSHTETSGFKTTPFTANNSIGYGKEVLTRYNYVSEGWGNICTQNIRYYKTYANSYAGGSAWGDVVGGNGKSARYQSDAQPHSAASEAWYGDSHQTSVAVGASIPTPYGSATLGTALVKSTEVKFTFQFDYTKNPKYWVYNLGTYNVTAQP